MYANPMISERQTVEKSSGTGTVFGILKVRRKKRSPQVAEAKITGIVSQAFDLCHFDMR